MLYEKDLVIQEFVATPITGVYVHHTPMGIGFLARDPDGKKRSRLKQKAEALRAIEPVVRDAERWRDRDSSDTDDRKQIFDLETSDVTAAAKNFIEALRGQMRGVGRYSATLLDGSRITVRFGK